jgi:hypothetical protein
MSVDLVRLREDVHDQRDHHTSAKKKEGENDEVDAAGPAAILTSQVAIHGLESVELDAQDGQTLKNERRELRR